MASFDRRQADEGRPVIRCFVTGAPDQPLTRAVNAPTADPGPADDVSLPPRRTENILSNDPETAYTSHPRGVY
jgi:hypothetical protein